jgi:hypothetical protein
VAADLYFRTYVRVFIGTGEIIERVLGSGFRVQ